jgi:hypothetical protein
VAILRNRGTQILLLPYVDSRRFCSGEVPISNIVLSPLVRWLQSRRIYSALLIIDIGGIAPARCYVTRKRYLVSTLGSGHAVVLCSRKQS